MSDELQVLEQKVNELNNQLANANEALAKANTENVALKNQHGQNQAGIQGLLAQVEAYKQTIAEANQVGINLRTNCILLDKSNKELALANEALKKEIAELKAAK